jgi:hypothetical protein
MATDLASSRRCQSDADFSIEGRDPEMAGAPKLIILSEQLRGQTFELTAPSYSIGRSEECDIYIPDPSMSGRHCFVRQDEENKYTLVDDNSTNGTRLNGIRIESQALTNSDIIQVGGVELLYDCEEKSVTAMLSSQTGINLEEGTGQLPVSEMSNFSPFRSQSGIGKADHKWVIWAIRGVMGLLLLTVLVLLAMVLLKLVG